MANVARLLLVARASPLADGLLGFFTTIPEVQVVGRVDEVPSSPAPIVDLAPSVVVLAFGPSTKQSLAAMRRVQAAVSDSRCVVLANDVHQQQAAETGGADAVLIKGCRPAELAAAIRAMATAGQ